MLEELFPDPPRSRIGFPRGVRCASYIRVPTSSEDWMGADWVTPTSLDFRQEQIQSERYRCYIEFPTEEVIHPVDLVERLAALWHTREYKIAKKRYVVDRDEEVGFRFGQNFALDTTIICADTKCWPAIEGVTVDKTETTW